MTFELTLFIQDLSM